MIAKKPKKPYGLWGMGYAPKIPANQLGKSKSVWPMREYGLYLVCVTRESTVWTGADGLCGSQVSDASRAPGSTRFRAQRALTPYSMAHISSSLLRVSFTPHAECLPLLGNLSVRSE